MFKTSYVDYIDDADNGVAYNPLSCAISSFAPAWDSEKDIDEAFYDAINFALKIIENEVSKAKSRVLAAGIIKNKILNTKDKVMILDKYMPWQIPELFNSDILYVVFKGATEIWAIQAVPKSVGGLNLRKPFPEDWRGLANEDLAMVTEIKSAIFCNSDGFLAVCKYKEDAIKLAYKAVNM